MKQFCILLIFSLASCSVKKQATRINKEIDTKVSTITEVVKNDSIQYDADTYEIVVEQKDSLKPVTIVLNGIVNTFTNTRSITIRKKKESLKTHLNEKKVVAKDSIVKQEIRENVRKKEKTFDYKALYPILLVLILAIALRMLVKNYLKF